MSFQEEVVKYNRELLDEAVAMLLKEWKSTKFPVPPDMEAPCMRLITMPYVSSLEPPTLDQVGIERK